MRLWKTLHDLFISDCVRIQFVREQTQAPNLAKWYCSYTYFQPNLLYIKLTCLSCMNTTWDRIASENAKCQANVNSEYNSLYNLSSFSYIHHWV
jgi:hypothetical protein